MIAGLALIFGVMLGFFFVIFGARTDGDFLGLSFGWVGIIFGALSAVAGWFAYISLRSEAEVSDEDAATPVLDLPELDNPSVEEVRQPALDESLAPKGLAQHGGAKTAYLDDIMNHFEYFMAFLGDLVTSVLGFLGIADGHATGEEQPVGETPARGISPFGWFAMVCGAAILYAGYIQIGGTSIIQAISSRNYDAVTIGMSYDQVVKMVGQPTYRCRVPYDSVAVFGQTSAPMEESGQGDYWSFTGNFSLAIKMDERGMVTELQRPEIGVIIRHYPIVDAGMVPGQITIDGIFW